VGTFSEFSEESQAKVQQETRIWLFYQERLLARISLYLFIHEPIQVKESLLECMILNKTPTVVRHDFLLSDHKGHNNGYEPQEHNRKNEEIVPGVVITQKDRIVISFHALVFVHLHQSS
jgi:hypothetical protein